MDLDKRQIKLRENRLRRMAARKGLRLAKSRTRDQRAYTYGTYCLIDVRRNARVAGDPDTGYGLGLADVEEFLAQQCSADAFRRRRSRYADDMGRLVASKDACVGR